MVRRWCRRPHGERNQTTSRATTRTSEATTDGAFVVQPNELKAKNEVTLTIDPAHAFRIRGLVTDQTG
jgi:hypothetical protein